MSNTQSQGPEFYLLSKRDAAETRRLNSQHKLAVALHGGNLLHPSISRDGIHKVADVATGTGIWMKEVAAEFASGGGVGKNEFHGFDISSEQFPESYSPELNFHIQDVKKPFPSEYRGTFDLVHVSLLVAALKADEFKSVFENITSLLKSGGFLQWDELYMNGFISKPVNEITDRIAEQLRTATITMGMAVDLPEMIRQYCVEAGMTQVIKFTPDPWGHREHAAAMREWYFNALRGVLPSIFMRIGQAADEKMAEEQAEELVKEVEGVFDNTDMVPSLPLARVVGKKV